MYLAFLYPPLICSILAVLLVCAYPPSRKFGRLILLASLISIIFSAVYLISNSFTGKGVDESVMFHLLYALDMEAILNHGVGFAFFLLLTFFVCWLLWRLFSLRAEKRPLSARGYGNVLLATFTFCLALFSVAVHPLVSDVSRLATKHFFNGSSELLDELLVPVSVASVDTPKSFIYIYAESLERTYFDETAFPGLVPNLKSLVERKGISIHGIKQIPMTSWTIAGMTASQCGIPLSTFRENRNDFDGVREFLPGIDCLGDILSAQGYWLGYLGGADLNFGGKGMFYKTHGFDLVEGLHEIQARHPDVLPTSKWGIYDDSLLKYAKKVLKEKASTNEAFGLFLLTLDTHSPSGFMSPSCEGTVYGDGKSGLLNSVKCADTLLGSFLEEVLSDPSFSDVVVVLASDHLAMANDAGLLALDATRENLWVAFNAGDPAVVSRLGTTLDIAPSFLRLLNFRSDRLGLGVDLFSDTGQSLLEKHGREELEALIAGWKAAFWRFWDSDSGFDRSMPLSNSTHPNSGSSG